MVKWLGYCVSENIWEFKVYLSSEFIEVFESSDFDLVRVEVVRERIVFVFERGMKVFL